ncbi:MAG: galactokinase, partial [bacterium]
GEHTDYSGGLVLPFALDQRAHVAVATRDDDRIRLALAGGERAELTLADLGPGSPAGWAAYLAGAVWALREAGFDIPGFDLALESRVPVGAGLSSSAALMSATLLALDGIHGLGLDRPALAALGRRAENVVAGVPCGAMDHAASLLCTTGHALLLDTGSERTRQVPLDPEARDLALLLLDTGHPHALADGRYARCRAAIDAANAVTPLAALDPDDLAALPTGTSDDVRRAARHVVTENARVRAAVALLDAGQLEDIGPILDRSHASLRDDLRVSSPGLDAITSAARASGALGARMTGAGFGGSAIALVPRDRIDAVTRAASDAVPGARIRQVTPSAGACRDD